MHWLMNTESGFCLIAIAVIASYIVVARYLFRKWGNQAAVQMRANYKKSQEA